MASVTIPGAPMETPNEALPETQPTNTGGIQVVSETPVAEQAPVVEEKPKLAGKFDDVAALEKAYTELQAKLGAPKTPDAPAAPPAAEAIENSGLDLNAIAAEYASNNGALAEATTKALTAKGLTVDNVKAYVDGQTAISKQVRAEFAAIAGSEEALDAVREWAPNNLPKAEVDAYTAAVDRGDSVVAKMLFENMVTKYQAKHGVDPKLVTGDTVPAKGTEVFANWGQANAAMDDPRYDSDEAYRESVDNKIGRSPNL